MAALGDEDGGGGFLHKKEPKLKKKRRLKFSLASNLSPHLMMNGMIILSTTPTSSGITLQLLPSNLEHVVAYCVHSDDAARESEA